MENGTNNLNCNYTSNPTNVRKIIKYQYISANKLKNSDEQITRKPELINTGTKIKIWIVL